MGVRGLTSFIARHAEQYLQPYELHDCNLIIDGDNLACKIYGSVTGIYSAFGGDYDDFFRSVVNFFHVLQECNIQSFVLMDGGYERKKLKTVGKRLRGKISVIKKINPNGSITVFPPLMKEVFISAVREMNVPIMRCVFEADEELAALGRKFRCPVLSYDSDFYIHNVKYIPIITLTIKAHTKRVSQQNEQKTKLRKNQVTNLGKRTTAQRIIGEIQVNNIDAKSTKSYKTYKYLDCCIYRIENLMSQRSLSKEKMPLFAALLGNDYISRSCFRNFFANGLGKAGRSRKTKQQQRRIKLILKWLKDESLESALEKICSRLRKHQRDNLMAQVSDAITGYSNEKCNSYDYFMTNYKHLIKEFENIEDDEDFITSDTTTEDFSDDDDEEDVINGVDGEKTTEIEDETDINPDSDGSIEENDSRLKGDEKQFYDDKDEIENQLKNDDNDEVDENDDDYIKKHFPDWFLKKLFAADYPRFFVDLLYLHKYINSPQIEHYPYNDCNEVAIPILNYIFTLLNNIEGIERKPRIDQDGTEIPHSYTYVTRATRVTNIRYYKNEIEKPPVLPFNPRNPDKRLFHELFNGKMHQFDTEEFFAKVKILPHDLKLYFIAIVYWLQKSQHCDLIHLHALIICLVVLRTVDSNIPVERNVKEFKKRFGRIIKTEQAARLHQIESKTINEELLSLSVPERIKFIPKSDCYLVQEKLLPHFHIQPIFKKKYDAYSTIVLHGYAEFQAILFQLYALNALLDFPYQSPCVGKLYCGVFIYNLYDLLKSRVDLKYYVEHFLFPDSKIMYDFYSYLLDWCSPFIPHWKNENMLKTKGLANKKLLKKQRQAAKKKSAKESESSSFDPYAENVDKENDEDDEFYDLNNKFCTFLKVQ